MITRRFGLNGQRSRTLAEVGRDYRVTRERIRQIQHVALTKLRRILERDLPDDSLMATLNR